MLVQSTDHLSKATTQGTSNKGYGVPDPSNRGACARFRLRGKTRTSAPRCPSSSVPTVSQLQQTTIQLQRELNCLSETVLLQARALNDHLLSCTSMVQEITTHVRAGLLPIQPQIQIDKDDTIFYGTSNPAPTIPIPDPSSFPASSTSSPPTQIIPTSCSDLVPDTSISSTLPRLRGYFNKPKLKVQT